MFSRRPIGISLIVLAAAVLSVYLVAKPQIIRFLEISISTDGEIMPDGVRQISYLVFLQFSLVGILGVILVKSKEESWSSSKKLVFFKDPFAFFVLGCSNSPE